MPFNCTEADDHWTAWSGNGGDMLKKRENLLMCKDSHCCSSKRNPERSHVSKKAVGTTYELLKDRN